MTFKRSAATFVCVSAVLGSVLGGVANADPDNSATLTYHYTDCTGSPYDFYAVKQPSGAAATHLVNGSGTFVALKAVVLGDQTVGDTSYKDSTVLFATPGFEHNDLPTITCTNLSPSTGIRSRVTGQIVPAK